MDISGSSEYGLGLGDSDVENDGDIKSTFVGRLHTMISQVTDDIIGFIDDGSSFQVRDPKRLELEALPKHAIEHTFESFVRHLNLYNFKKCSKDRHVWVYRHELFHRDKPELLDGVKRKSATSSDDVPTPLRRTISTSEHIGNGGPPLRRTSSESAIQLAGSVWREVLDDTTGEVYYWNTFTGHIQWDIPPDYEYHRSHPGFRLDTSAQGVLAPPPPAGSKRGRSQQPMDKAGGGGEVGEGASPTSPPKRPRKPLGSRAPGEAAAAAAASAEREEEEESSKWGNDTFYSEGGDAAKLWGGLDISPEVLAELQRNLYERHTSPALVALVTFGLRATPYQKPSMLLAAVQEKLNSHDELWRELKRYREALEPKVVCENQLQDATAPSGEMWYEHLKSLDPSARSKSEVMLVREFMAFVVTRLQMVHDLCEAASPPLDDDQLQLLFAATRLWWNHANRYL